MKLAVAATTVLTVLLSSSLPAQRTYVVDAAGGSGAHFRDLPDALRLAQHGDTIILRKGTYRGGATSLGLTILGEKDAVINGMLAPVNVSNLPAGQRFVMQGIEFTGQSLGAYPSIALTSNAGSVHLEDLALAPLLSGGPTGPAVMIRDCKRTTLNDCQLVGHPALDCEASTVVISASVFQGSDAEFNMVPVPSAPGLRAKNATLEITTSAFGGGKEAPSFVGPQLASPGLDLETCDVRLVGPCLCIAGQASNPTPGMESVWGRDSTVRWSTDMQLRSSGTARAYSLTTGGRVIVEEVAALIAAGVAPGGLLPFSVFGMAADMVFTLAGVPATPQSLPFGMLWFDPASAILLDAAPIQTSRYHMSSVPIPNRPELRGQVLALQSYVIRPSKNPHLSSAAFVVLN